MSIPNLLTVDDADDSEGIESVPGIDIAAYKAKDLELYNKWAQTKSKKDMSSLVSHLKPLIIKEVKNTSGSLPTAALSGEAKVWTVKAIKTFDPSKGFALSTHVTNYIRRTRRLNYKYQNAARLPEDMNTDFKYWNTAKQQLEDELGAEPSTEHLAERLGWSKAKVQRFQSRIYSDNIESMNENPTEYSRYSDESLLMNSLLSNLNEEERFILENKGKISSTELANKLNINTNSLNYKIRKLTEKITMLKHSLGI